MKKIVSFILCIFLTQCVFAAKPEQGPEKVLVQIDFIQERPQGDEVVRARINNHLRLLTDNHLWAVVPDRETRRKHVGHLMLLTKIHKAEAKQVQVDFLILDVRSKPRVVGMPTLRVPYGKPGHLVINKGANKIELNILAKSSS